MRKGFESSGFGSIQVIHGIANHDIRQEDTIRHPQHKAENGELARYDCVAINSPFHQNYIKKDIEYPGCFASWR